jgi:S1/P1 Nuclease
MLGKEAATMLDARAWAYESHALAKSAAYDEEVLAALRRMEAGAGPIAELELSEAYLKAGGHLAETRLVQAEYRLGAVLKDLVGN